jgi:septum formation protein
MLKSLSGCTHSVFTGVTLVFMNREGRVGEHTFYDETKVSFYPVDEEEIRAYVGREDVLDKAGAYGIQTGAAAFVRSIEGDFYNVVGLPIARILDEIKNIL